MQQVESSYEWFGVDLAKAGIGYRTAKPERILNHTKRKLQTFFQIDSLTTIEQWHLRNVLVSNLKKHICQLEQHREKEYPGKWLINSKDEAILQWVHELYRDDIYRHPVLDVFRGEMNSYTFKEYMDFYNTFVEDLNRLRDKAHLI